MSVIQELAQWAPLEAVREAVIAQGVPPEWSDIPGLTLFFCALYFVSLPLWYVR